MLDALVLVTVITALILANAFFVAAEFALVAASRPRIERLASKGHPRAVRVRALLASASAQDRYLATTQLGLSLVSLALGMYGEHSLALALVPWLARSPFCLGASDPLLTAHAVATSAVLLFLTFWHIVLGEMVPKSVALAMPERVAFACDRPMRLFHVLFHPLVAVLHLLGNATLRLLRLPLSTDASCTYTPEELRTIAGDSAAEGLLDPTGEQFMRRVIDFERQVTRHIMVSRTRAVGLLADLAVEQAAPVAAGEGYTRYPVYEGNADHVVGIVHVRDLLRAVREGRRSQALRELVRPTLFVPESLPISLLFARMQQEKVHLAVVLDERGGTAGIVTMEDVIEQIFGEVKDEFDTEEEDPWLEMPDGSVRVQGHVTLVALDEALGLALARPHVDTVNGLVTLLLGRPPRHGDTVVAGPHLFHVDQVRGHAVGRATIRPCPAQADACASPSNPT